MTLYRKESARCHMAPHVEVLLFPTPRLYKDKNGTIEDEELSGFLKDLLELVYEDYDEDDLEYTKKHILQNWDLDHDGKVNLEEMKMLLMAYSARELGLAEHS
ncbi:unnamed protein product [Echinostoma caproni]|uniref:EF-hand domain-containing protein n=1 Tax=Echinostoma caproni TaxID=27848 RepID=A0A183A8M4_9TREM|nr:unnamed protein product [Echinostoma caproni]